LITEGVATRKEINESYTFIDIMEALAVLDMKTDIEAAIGELTAPKIPSV
jgi:hypothetical protein